MSPLQTVDDWLIHWWTTELVHSLRVDIATHLFSTSKQRSIQSWGFGPLASNISKEQWISQGIVYILPWRHTVSKGSNGADVSSYKSEKQNVDHHHLCWFMKPLPLSNRLSCQLLGHFLSFDLFIFSINLQSELRTFHFHLLLLLQGTDTCLQRWTINDLLVSFTLQRKSFHLGGGLGNLTTLFLSKVQASTIRCKYCRMDKISTKSTHL